MKKIIPLFILTLILVCPIFAENVSANTVFITSDNVLGQNEDYNMLNEIKNIIESKTNGQINVIVDNKASSPGEGARAMNAKCDVAVTIAYACAGNLVDLAKYSTKVNKKIVYVNVGYLDLNSVNFLRRSYDDNWSPSSFAAIKSPGKFLRNSGVKLIQPGQIYPEETNNKNLDHTTPKINEYIADEIIKTANSNKPNKQLDSALIVTHKLSPKYLAEDSKKIVDDIKKGKELSNRYGSYTTQQLLYMSASYLTGYSLDVPKKFKAPDNPDQYSLFVKDSYSFNDYCKMADKVVDYMNNNGNAPNSITYNGATISYYDLVYNFALLTENHTDANNMDFPQRFEFHKYNDNALLSIFPIALIFIVLLLVIIIVKKIYKKIKRHRRGNTNHRNSRYNNYKNHKNTKGSQNMRSSKKIGKSKKHNSPKRPKQTNKSRKSNNSPRRLNPQRRERR